MSGGAQPLARAGERLFRDGVAEPACAKQGARAVAVVVARAAGVLAAPAGNLARQVRERPALGSRLAPRSGSTFASCAANSSGSDVGRSQTRRSQT